MLKFYKDDFSVAALTVFIMLVLGVVIHGFILKANSELQNLIVFAFILFGAIFFLLLFLFFNDLSDDYKRKESPNGLIWLVSFGGFVLFLLGLLIKSIIISTDSQGVIGVFFVIIPDIIWFKYSFLQIFVNAGYILYVLFAKEKNMKTFFDNSFVFLVGIVLSFINTYLLLSQYIGMMGHNAKT